ncbi:MAG TPA: aspartyl/asparaginyl beta-hydroxylase domain-containing protein [Xanthobacteraceae bacterium]|nr:aspartyl/asparaginyl beta-hydroxylase domain-containing protein [Xanthobacteraceae bacterium]
MTVKYQFAVLLAAYVGSFAYLYVRCHDHLPLHKYLSNHVLLFAPLNFVFTFFTTGRQASVFAPSTVPGLDKLRASYPVIREEAKVLLDAGVFQRPPAVDEPGYNTFEKGGWRLYPLKWYTEKCAPSAVRTCPRTCAVLDSIPTIRSAMFTVLPPGGRLGRHHDPVASSLRYHLGLLTPNSDKCALMLDGVQHVWRDGEELLFDQTYLHSAVNNTDTVRVILFCDVEKTQLLIPVKQLADALNYALVAKFTGADEKGKLSWISSIYKPIYRVRSFVKEEIKPRSKLAYNVIKYGSIALGLYLIYLAI